MDAGRKLSEREADQALKDLFGTSGVISAPDGLDARIMQRIALSAKPAVIKEPGLIPTWVWILSGLALLALAIYLYTAPVGATDPGPVEHVLSMLPQHSLRTLLTSQWVLMGTASLGLLMALDVALRRMRIAGQPSN